MRTRQPCPGCKKVDRYRPADSVCTTCAANLKAWEDYSARLDIAAKSKTAVMVKLSSVDYAWPGFYSGAEGFGLDGFRDHQEGLTRAFHQLAHRLAQLTFPQDSDPDGFHKAERLMFCEYDDPALSEGQPDWFDIPALYTAADVNLFRELYRHAAMLAHLCYLDGRRQGQDVLKELARGSLSVDELNEKNVRLAGEVQTANRGKPKKKNAKRGGGR